MAMFSVTLMIDVDADSPEEAAAQFREFLDSERRVYVVVENHDTRETTEMDT